MSSARDDHRVWPPAAGAVTAAVVAFLAIQYVVVGCAFEGMVGLGGGCDLSGGQIALLALGLGAAVVALGAGIVAVRRAVTRRRP